MSDISVIGVGNIGKLVINKIVEYNNKIQTIFITQGEDEIKDCNANIILNINENLATRLKQIIFKNRIFIVSHVGEKECNEINIQICNQLKNDNNEVVEICSFPFTFEGRTALNSAENTIRKIGKAINQIIVTDCDLILRDLDKKMSIKEVFELVAEILYLNLQDTFRNVEMKYQKLIVDYKEKCEEMRKRELRMKEMSKEFEGNCCIMMRKRRIREE